MDKLKIKGLREIIIFILLTSLLVLNYYKGFDEKNRDYYDFGRTSQCLAEATIYAAVEDIDKQAYGLGHLNENGLDYEQVTNDLPESENLTIRPYKSQFGLQGNVFYLLAKILPLTYSRLLYVFMIMTAFAMAVTAMLIVMLIKRKYNVTMAGVFYYVFLSSPWICLFARDLYWVEFTWFLPMLAGLYFSIEKKKICYIFAFLTVMVKALCGYEYITAVMLGLILFPAADLLTETSAVERRKYGKQIICLGFAALLGFICAYTFHAYFNGDGNILQGMIQIYQDVAVRRTSGGAEGLYGGDIGEAAAASIIQVIYMYICFNSELLAGVGGNLFPYLIIASAAILIYRRFYQHHPKAYMEALYIMSLLTSLSWFIFGKAHSYNHPHMNYVLWYFGFVQICIYVVIDWIKEKVDKKGL